MCTIRLDYVYNIRDMGSEALFDIRLIFRCIRLRWSYKLLEKEAMSYLFEFNGKTILLDNDDKVTVYKDGMMIDKFFIEGEDAYIYTVLFKILESNK